MSTKGLEIVRAEVGEANAIQRARVRKTDAFFDERPAFMAELEAELARFIAKAKRDGFTPAVRLNGTSDIRFEGIACPSAPSLMLAFPDVQFYDYTKLANRRNLPSNYHLTYSLAEGERNWRGHLVALGNGMGVAVVLRGFGDSTHPLPLPPKLWGRKLIDGDESDLRFRDPRAVYVGLRAKGRAKLDQSGFVKDWAATLPEAIA